MKLKYPLGFNETLTFVVCSIILKKKILLDQDLKPGDARQYVNHYTVHKKLLRQVRSFLLIDPLHPPDRSSSAYREGDQVKPKQEFFLFKIMSYGYILGCSFCWAFFTTYYKYEPRLSLILLLLGKCYYSVQAFFASY